MSTAGIGLTLLVIGILVIVLTALDGIGWLLALIGFVVAIIGAIRRI